MKTIVMGLISLMWVNIFAYTDVNTRFYFDTDKDTLNQQQLSELNKFIQDALSAKKYREIYVVGFTDADGTNGYNLDLSQRRAKNISELLIQKGIPESMIDKQYKGEDQPIATNKTETGKSLNRRVEVILRVFDINKAADIIHEIQGNPEKKFTIDNTEAVTLHGNKGMSVTFPPNCFQTADNKSTDPKNITIELEEVRTVQDALFSGVLSQSNTQPLESGGMFRIKASLNGKELKMKPGMQYSVQLLNTDLKNNMSVFAPAPNPGGLIAWTDTKEVFKKDSAFKGDRPYIKLDKEIINAWKIEMQHDGFLDSYTFQLPAAPVRPNISRRPKDVKEPVKDLDKYEIPWMKRLFMTKAAEQKERENRWAKEYALYQKQHTSFFVKLKKYESDSAKISDQMLAYEEANKIYSRQLQQIADDLQNYRKAMVENVIHSGFENMKKMLVYKSDNRILRSKDIYADIYQYFNNLVLYNKYNIAYMDLYDHYSEKFNKICLRDFPDSNFYIFPQSSYTLYDGYYYLYNYAFQLLHADKTIEAHFEKAIDAYVQAELKSGVFDPNSFTTYYQASLNQLDWVNCDRFYDVDKSNMITVQIPNYDIMDKNIIAVVKDMNSTLTMPLSGNVHRVSVPKNKQVVILAIGLDKNYTPVLARADLKTEKNVQVPLTFKHVKLSEIKNAINDI